MIPRYSRPEGTAIWTRENRFKIWLEIETLAAEAMAEQGTIPETAARAIRARGNFNVEEIDRIEAEVRHDVIAFLTSVTNHVGEEARFLHQGLTSSDILDTALAVQLTQVTDLILKDLDRLLEALKVRALEHKHTPAVGRSHGIHAEPTTIGLKLAGFYAEFTRNRHRLEKARTEIAVCALSGAVGSYATVDPDVEAYVAKNLDLNVESVSTQVIPRDRHATYFATLGVIASSIERLATEIRHLQRTEVREAEEYFAAGQKGSSAMPHKRNPVLCENLTGLARLIRSTVAPAMENVALWHERDISHSSVERVIAPEATILADFALSRLAGVIEKLIIYPEAAQKNLDHLGGLVFSQRVLLALTRKDISRETAYQIVQENAMKVWEKGGDFQGLLKADSRVTSALEPKEIEALFDISEHLKNVDTVFERVLPT